MSDGIDRFPSVHLTPTGADAADSAQVPQTVEILDEVPNPPESPLPLNAARPVHTSTQILLRFSDRPDPLVIHDPEFVLGRAIEKDRSITVDLSPYRGYVLGVSRQHAVITYTSEGYIIKDLGSANGTWLNGTRLSGFVPYLLSDGDQIQLGRLSMTFNLSTAEISAN